MRTRYDNYKELYDKYADNIKDYSVLLKEAAEFFYAQKIGYYNVSDIAYPANEVLIDDAVLNTMSDIDRIVKYHHVEKPVSYKYAAYLCFWWLRAKPFSCKVNDYSSYNNANSRGFLHDNLYMDICKSVNELFIIDFMLNLVQINTKRNKCDAHSKTLSYDDMKDSLWYFLRYRHYTAQELELFLKGLCTCPLAP